MSPDWRPPSATLVALSDDQLCKIGLMAALETISRSHIMGALKGAAQLSVAEWKARESRSFKQLIDELHSHAEHLDDVLYCMTSRVLTVYQPILTHRHQHLHSVWGEPDNEGDQIAWDLKRNVQIRSANIDDALNELAEFTYPTKECLLRVADLVLDGKLTASTEETGISVRLRDRLVHL